MLAILMIAVLLLGVGGVYLLIARGDRRRGALLLLAALVLLGNVLVWSV